MNRKLLIAFDNLQNFQNILQYFLLMFAGQSDLDLKILTNEPVYTGEGSKALLESGDLLSVIDNTTRKKFIDRKKQIAAAGEKLAAGGFDKERIDTEVRLSQSGITSEIVFEAQKHQFDAILISKRDLSRLEKMIKGSTSTEILKKNDDIPLWLISGAVNSRKILVPVDCSPHTLDAVDHLAFILKDNAGVEILLFHSCSLLAGEHITPKEDFYEKWGKEWCDEHLKGDAGGHFHFLAPEQILREAGFPPERVSRLQTRTGIEPGQQIVYYVRSNPVGTIVMGRRHHDVNKGIFRGVSDRVLANVRNVALWVVG